MTIVPSGKIRLMEAQQIGDPLLNTSDPTGRDSSVGNDISSVGTDPNSVRTDPNSIGNEPIPEIDPEEGNEMIDEQEPKKKTLSDFIFKKLESFGYPGRRLEEFKKKFVTQEVSADGTENVKVEIPDKHYPNPATGETKTIESSDLNQIVREIGKTFGLNFTGAHRSEGKWTIDFSSAKPLSDEEQRGSIRDNLDEVYGTPTGNKEKKTTPVRAFTIHEMIKSGKDRLSSTLKKVLRGEK